MVGWPCRDPCLSPLTLKEVQEICLDKIVTFHIARIIPGSNNFISYWNFKENQIFFNDFFHVFITEEKSIYPRRHFDWECPSEENMYLYRLVPAACQLASQGQTLKCGWCSTPALSSHCWLVSVKRIYSEVLTIPVLCVYGRYALGLRNDNRRTCDGLKNHAPVLSTLQPACDEWCIINPDPLPVERLKKQERSFLILASSGLKPPSCLGYYINQNLGLAIFYR